MTAQLVLIKAALAFYAAATALAFTYLFSKDEKWSQWSFRALSLGLICHFGGFGVRCYEFWQIPENRFFFPINTFFGALSFFSLAIAVVFFVVEQEARLGILGAFVLPFPTIGLLSAIVWADPKIAGLVPALQSYWINIHPMVLMTAYAAFGVAFGVGIALLVQERQLKSRKPAELCYRLPSIEELDNLNYKIIVAAFPTLTVGIIMGGIWAYNAWGRFWGWDPKETWALITALIYAGYLHMRFLKGMRGRKSVYVSMVGFVAVIFTFIGVNYLSELHGYLSGRG